MNILSKAGLVRISIELYVMYNWYQCSSNSENLLHSSLLHENLIYNFGRQGILKFVVVHLGVHTI